MHLMGYRVELPVLAAVVLGPLVVGLVMAIPAIRRRGALSLIGMGVFVWAGCIVAAATLTPASDPLTSGACSFVLAPAPLWADDQRLLNCLMFIPLGIGAALAPRAWLSRLTALTLLASVPFVLEGAQALDWVGRACDVNDLVDNWIGIAMGFVAGTTVALLATGLRREAQGSEHLSSPGGVQR